jgi:hypothetical protein
MILRMEDEEVRWAYVHVESVQQRLGEVEG